MVFNDYNVFVYMTEDRYLYLDMYVCNIKEKSRGWITLQFQ